MNRPVAHGAIVLAISLATVGAVVSSEQGPASGYGNAGDRPVLRSEAFDPRAAVPEVSIRDGRIDGGAAASAPEPASPAAIRVGAITLEAPVVAVGVDDTNQLDVPSAEMVGWYRYGASPGEAGASVLAAHVDYGGVPGAFFNLAQLAVGDLVEVELSDGSSLRYQVTHVYEIQKSELPADELFRKDGAPVLQLITCGGTFNPERRSYEANVVVTAEPLGDMGAGTA